MYRVQKSTSNFLSFHTISSQFIMHFLVYFLFPFEHFLDIPLPFSHISFKLRNSQLFLFYSRLIRLSLTMRICK